MYTPNDRTFAIHIEHLPTSEQITFRGWVKSFSDSFSSNWSTTQVYGRMDPLATFQSTGRVISLEFDVVAGSKAEAIDNDLNINRLIQFLYPVYDKGEGTTGAPADQAIVAAAPLLRMRYTNMIQNNVDQEGLLGYLAGVDYSPDLEAGQFFGSQSSFDKDTAPMSSGKFLGNPNIADTIFYQQLSINLQFTVLHSHLTGWVKGADNSFYFGKDARAGAKYVGNFPHGGTNSFIDKGRDPARTLPPDSAVDVTDESQGDGNNADIEQGKVGNVLGGT
jgi:hypothetical protein